MAKSNRRRKLDRAKRQVRVAQKQAVAGRRLADEKAIQDAVARYGRLVDPSTSVAELARLLDEEFGGDAVPTFAVKHLLKNGSSLERLAEAAETMLASGASLTALTFAAEVARAEGNAGRTHELIDRALAVVADDPGRRMGLLNHLVVSRRLADCLSLLEDVIRDTPDDGRAAELYGRGIQEAYRRVDDQQPFDPCSCGRGASWQECCGPRERAALSRFADRSAMTAMSDAVAAFLVHSEYGREVDDKVSEVVADYDDLEWKPDELASFRALLAEHALLTAKLPADEGEALDPLAAFAADPSVPRELAARADTWRADVHYGLWRIDGRSAAPGLWCTDLCAGIVRYAEFPAPLTGEWPRWSVWLGGLVPVDGVWRATGTGLRLSPAEADAVAEFVQDKSTSVMYAVAGKKRRSTPSAEPIRFGHAVPVGVMVDWRKPASSELVSVTGVVVGYLLPRIVGDVYQYRRTSAVPSGEGWEKYWLDQQVPALGGRTPREATTPKERLVLEALLRQFEYETDLLAAQGQQGIDTDWLRQELDMADETTG